MKSARGKKILVGTYGICSSAHDGLGAWDSLNKVNHEALILSVLTNTTYDKQFYKAGEIVGFLQPVQNILEHGLPEVRIDEVLSDFFQEPKDPVPGACSKELTEDERKFLEDTWL